MRTPLPHWAIRPLLSPFSTKWQWLQKTPLAAPSWSALRYTSCHQRSTWKDKSVTQLHWFICNKKQDSFVRSSRHEGVSSGWSLEGYIFFFFLLGEPEGRAKLVMPLLTASLVHMLKLKSRICKGLRDGFTPQLAKCKRAAELCWSPLEKKKKKCFHYSLWAS